MNNRIPQVSLVYDRRKTASRGHAASVEIRVSHDYRQKLKLDIIRKYDGKLPVISNQKYDDYLKLVALSAKVDKPLSSHWARHTGATLLLNEGVDMKVVSKICGHSSTRITEQVYAKLLDETVVDAVADIRL